MVSSAPCDARGKRVFYYRCTLMVRNHSSLTHRADSDDSGKHLQPKERVYACGESNETDYASPSNYISRFASIPRSDRSSAGAGFAAHKASLNCHASRASRRGARRPRTDSITEGQAHCQEKKEAAATSATGRGHFQRPGRSECGVVRVISGLGGYIQLRCEGGRCFWRD